MGLGNTCEKLNNKSWEQLKLINKSATIERISNELNLNDKKEKAEKAGDGGRTPTTLAFVFERPIFNSESSNSGFAFDL